ncbi:hypothetical protein AWM75_07090 [Aerococcus urinaehominis]|uniref:[Citrate [pro-3S]-lyase] ligase n=1 Tax=Aerococcus urinaehominis TaxID=128944 RepID=A0A0X8FN66_9LACT|nr:[citrate (pro-3S)-lyase] ligase [Aerococcus urinaehominis]AMB99742.1 hypothetical protein AWM75_07090 [Aerococcus urinaehominis]SDM10692.1 [citrate (pro-3S)-lyase] ligase [Aerococcus urinaehominis]
MWVERSSFDRQAWLNLLTSAGLRPEAQLDETIGLYDGDRLVATGSLQANVMKCLVVCQAYKGGAVMNQLVTELLNRIYQKGYQKAFVYTKPSSAQSFSHLNFNTLIATDQVVFMERATNGFDDYLARLGQDRPSGERIGAIVMNANPLTRGHLYLIESARSQCDIVHVFVLSEDRSLFPSRVRYQLVKEACQAWPDVYVHTTDDYMVSQATFPAYFLAEDKSVTQAQAEVDAMLFRDRIAPVLGITDRFVGTEPYSEKTAIYNQAMAACFGQAINLHVIPRLATDQAEDFISATKVREKFLAGDLAGLQVYLPQVTYDFLQSPAGQAIREQVLSD